MGGVTARPDFPEPLSEHHELDEFQSRSENQTIWLHEHARQSASAGSTRVFVVTGLKSPKVIGYYAWRMANIAIESAPIRMREGAGNYPQPGALLARLAVDMNYEGQGIGAGLLRDALARLVALSDEIGCRGLLVQAESIEAKAYYLRQIPVFETSATDDLLRVLLMKDIGRTLRSK